MFTEVPLGAQLLDEKRPGWRNEIVVRDLYMNSPFKCILGQLYGSYEYGLEKLGMGWDDEQRYDYGFSLRPRIDSLLSRDEWDKLTEAWIFEISKE